MASAAAIGKSDGSIDKHFLTQGLRGAHMRLARTGRADRDARKRREFGCFRQWWAKEIWPC